MLDQLFKWTALLIACGYLWAYWQTARNGRFVGAPAAMVTDSRTGKVYVISGGYMYEFNLIAGTVRKTSQTQTPIVAQPGK